MTRRGLFATVVGAFYKPKPRPDKYRAYFLGMDGIFSISGTPYRKGDIHAVLMATPYVSYDLVNKPLDETKALFSRER